jgi:hypothetical protein
MKESTSAFPKTTISHHEGNLECASFPSSTRATALKTTTLHREENLTRATLSSITSTNALP